MVGSQQAKTVEVPATGMITCMAVLTFPLMIIIHIPILTGIIIAPALLEIAKQDIFMTKLL